MILSETRKAAILPAEDDFGRWKKAFDPAWPHH